MNKNQEKWMDISHEKLLNRIIKGRLRIRLGDLILFVYEPDSDINEESFDVYDDTYRKAYFGNVFLKSDLEEVLFNNELWSPLDDKEADKVQKQIDDLKVEAYRSFFDKRKLRGIKAHVRHMEKKYFQLKSKKHLLDNVSCEGVAAFARSVWIISKTTYYQDGTPYDWKHCSLTKIMDKYNDARIDLEDFRLIAREDPWRGIWSQGKKTGNLFDKSVMELSKDQLNLCAFSSMYDAVYENPESPNDKIIQDDDCLDGWFIEQKRKRDKEKKQQEVDALTKNPKIKNSQEVFVMANSAESAKEIFDLNDMVGKATIHNRNAQIDAAEGNLDFRKLGDIRQDMATQSHQEGLSKIKGR